MRNHWTLKIAAPLASAAVLVGCGERAGGGHAPQSDAKASTAQSVVISGCVSSGIGNDQLMLTNIRFAPSAEQPSDAAAFQGSGLTEHAQVRLATSNDQELIKLVGQMASVTGTIKHDGRNTIGTTSTPRGPSDPESPVDNSQAASKQSPSEKVRNEAGPMGTRSMNNGTFPEIQVQSVAGSGQPCPTMPVENRR